MRVPISVLLFVFSTVAFQPPKIDVEERQQESHPYIGKFVELREHERLILKCYGRYHDLKFKFPNLKDNEGHDDENFQDRVQEEHDDAFGDKFLTINDVRESDTGTYSCVSEGQQSLNDSIHVFVHGTKIFLPLTPSEFMYEEGEVMVPCKTTEFVDKHDIELYANGKLVKEAPKSFDHRVGFKITKKVLEMSSNLPVNFECKHTKKPLQEVIYKITQIEKETDIEANYKFYWEKGFEWPHVGYNYSQTCHLAHNGAKLFSTFFHQLRIECDGCSHDANSHVYVESHKSGHNNTMSVTFRIEHLELEDSNKYKCIWSYENHQEKSIDYHLHVAPTRAQVKIIERSPQLLRVKEHRRTSLFAKFAVYPADEGNYVATWSRTYNSSTNGFKSEKIITDEIRTISDKEISNGIFMETLDLGSAAMTTSMSGTYRLSIAHMNTSQSVQWEVAIENDAPDVQITVRNSSSSLEFNQPFHAPDTALRIDCVSISIPPSTDVILEQKNKETGEYEEIDQSELVNVEGTFEKGSIWNINLTESAELRCTSLRQGKKYTATKSLIVSEKEPSIHITIEKSAKATESELQGRYYEGDNVMLTCEVPTEASDWHVSWRFNNNAMESSNTYFAKHAKNVVLNLKDIKASSSGNYSCVVKKESETTVLNIPVKVESISAPHHTDSNSRSAVKVDYNQNLELYCNMSGTPLPVFQWFKNGVKYTNRGRNESLLNITKAHEEHDGQFECRASNRAGTTSQFIEVQVVDAPKSSSLFYWVLTIFIIIFLGIIAFLCFKLRASKRITKQKDIALNELYKSMLENNAGPLPEDMKNLPIEERTYYLPYNKDYEIDPCNLEIGNVLGHGNFGIVKKGLLRMADPKSEIEAKVRLPVAVKSSSNPFDVETQRMMTEEVKIMNAIPKHPNVLSLIGAVTTNLRKGQLLIVTEYIDAGDLKSFLEKHRGVFVNELVEEDAPVDDSYMVPNSVTKRKKYKFEGEEERLLPDDNIALCTSDLLSIALQIANGMEWLANVPCIHRDLACRNVLITQSKIIRISDFGLSKRHNSKNYYRKKSDKNVVLPVRWMSKEAFDDLKFCEKSDVWSFGICLYEIFTLGGKPYPDLDTPDVMGYIRSGKLNTQPALCHDDVYELMKNCWKTSPKERPKFSECVFFLKEHMKKCVPELLERVDRMLHVEKEEQLRHEEFTKKSRTVVGRFQKKAPRKQEEERYLIVESHA